MSDPAAAIGGSPGSPRLLIGLQLFCGAGLLIAASMPPLDRADGVSGRRARLFARLLGARHLGEGLVLTRRASPNWILAGASVDALHGASMILLASVSPRWRRPALGNATAAAALCAYGIRCSLRRR